MTEAPPPAPSEHNPLFDHFVKYDLPAGDQLTGLVAYALYKQAKREWAAEHVGKPSEEQLRSYVKTWTRSRRDGLSDQAAQLLDSFASAYVEAAEPHIRARALKGTFWGAVWPAIMAAFIYTLLLILVTIVLHYSGVDFLELLHRVGVEAR